MKSDVSARTGTRSGRKRGAKRRGAQPARAYRLGAAVGPRERLCEGRVEVGGARRGEAVGASQVDLHVVRGDEDDGQRRRRGRRREGIAALVHSGPPTFLGRPRGQDLGLEEEGDLHDAVVGALALGGEVHAARAGHLAAALRQQALALVGAEHRDHVQAWELMMMMMWMMV